MTIKLEKLAKALYQGVRSDWGALLGDGKAKDIPKSSDLMSQASTIRAVALRLLEVAEYLENRANPSLHESSLKAAHKTMVKVRRALGYTYPDRF